MQKKYALISVSDKSGIVEVAQSLNSFGYTVLSTGGTYKLLSENEVLVEKVGDISGFPEILDGRVKTLHPKIHGALLALKDCESHKKECLEHEIPNIEIVIINLYPFVEVVKKKDCSHEVAIENIDIGGPTMIRASAKNYKFITIVTDPIDYDLVLSELKLNGETSLSTRQLLATKAFALTKEYDSAINMYMREISELPEEMTLKYEKVRTLRYGENPHQKAAFFKNPYNTDSNITNATVLSGKELSFNNIVDGDSAIELVKEFGRPTAVFVKHNNPCGVASATTIVEAFKLSHQVDTLSSFGAVVALNGECNDEIVDYIKEHKLFLEIVICTRFTPSALSRLKENPNIRLLQLGDLKIDKDRRDIKKVAGGILIQTADTSILSENNLKVVTKKQPTNKQLQSMLFARKVVKHVKSNAIVFATTDEHNNEIVTGIGAGQMSRVDSVYIARHKGGEKVKNSVMASDAFFPFSDSIEEAHKAGVSSILQPGGSIRDNEVIEKANELDISMVFTGIRSFRH